MRKRVDLAGRKFGSLTVLYRLPVLIKKNAYWACSCVCGGKSEVAHGNLTTGRVMSCGRCAHNLGKRRGD